MGRLTIVSCMFNRHEPDRANVVPDGFGYSGTCVRCGAAIRRKSHRQWRRDKQVPDKPD